MDPSTMGAHGGRTTPADAVRLRRPQRREALLDAAAALVEAGQLDAVTMESVAEQAGVSRALVYKHFANRGDLLAAVYRREAAHLHDRLSSEVVAAAGSLEAMFRALIRGALRAAAERGHLFAALRSAGAWSPEIRREQRGRDRTTLRVFADIAARDLGTSGPKVTETTALLLSLVDPVLARWRLDPTPEQAALLEDTYMMIVSSSLAALTAPGE